ncbi:ChaC-like protein [Flammula alnicola]|nr:ChaC-like protein [Flammula alnicola]
MTSNAPPFVVFGYGSLIFKPPPHVIAQVPGYLKGYVRRFAQKSHDHRGTPESPGRVVTLVHKEEWDKFSQSDAFPHDDTVWGVAYTIDPVHETEVRWIYNGKLDIYGVGTDGDEIVIISNSYVGRNDNPSFIGSEPLDILGHRIWQSVGPSGPNKEYLFRLVESVRQLSPSSYDSHLYALEAIVQHYKRHGQGIANNDDDGEDS